MMRGKRKKRKTYLPISHLPEALEDLLRRILILRDLHHEPDELLKVHSLPPSTADLHEPLMHLLVIIYQPQTRQRGGKLQLLQRIAAISIKMPEDALEFLQLNGR